MKANQRRYILAIDIGGTHVKVRVSNRRGIERFDSSRRMTPFELVQKVRRVVNGWTFHLVTVGFPGMVIDGRIISEPINLGHGWVGFDFARAFNRPTRIVNDAVMQALGGYSGGRMLFLGFGTALGAVAIVDARVYAMELAHLPFTKHGLIQKFVGNEALCRLGPKRWSLNVKKVVKHISGILDADDVVVGGGNACKIMSLPRQARLGHTDMAFVGGFRVWRRSFALQI